MVYVIGPAIEYAQNGYRVPPLFRVIKHNEVFNNDPAYIVFGHIGKFDLFARNGKFPQTTDRFFSSCPKEVSQERKENEQEHNGNTYHDDDDIPFFGGGLLPRFRCETLAEPIDGA